FGDGMAGTDPVIGTDAGEGATLGTGEVAALVVAAGTAAVAGAVPRAAWSSASGIAEESVARISTPPATRRFETINASGPRARRTWRIASRVVIPKNL